MKVTKVSTMGALARGDVENAIISETPGGIEAQEKQGQTTFVNASTLPRSYNSGTRQMLEKDGVVFGENIDDLFVNVTLPAGWSKQAIDHSMWSHLLDDKGRKRASIFYKAAFYDQRAFISVERRFSWGDPPFGGYDGEEYKSHRQEGDFLIVGQVIDCGKVVFETEPHRKPPYSKREIHDNTIQKQCEGWLAEHYPDWQDATAYWD